MYIPDNRYIWDFWLAIHGGRYHLFHLQAPRALPDPEMRHGLAVVGHAVSRDLFHWEDRGVVLKPGAPGEWDDRAIWTGSVIEKGGTFYMLYTGTNLAENGKIQRIGLALSGDLCHWEKHPDNPVLEADLSVYEGLEASPFGELAWRDPWLLRYRDTYIAFITARRKGEGCIATAVSDDLVHWEIGPPLDVPGEFAQMEVPQVISHDGSFYLLFSVEAGWIGAAVHPKVTGTFYAVAADLFGPYSSPRLLLGDHRGSFYAAKLVQTLQGNWVILAWKRVGSDGRFVGGLTDPFPVCFEADGGIKVETCTSS